MPTATSPAPTHHCTNSPRIAIQQALEREGLTAADLDVVEINEAFAAVGLVSMRKLGLTDDQVNPHGGAIALGHPVGMSGARLALSLAWS